MGMINRLFLLFQTLCMIAMSVAVLGAATTLLPEQLWLNEAHYALTRYETVIIAVCLMLISIRLLAAVFRRADKKTRGKGEYVIESSPNGEVRVSLEAIRLLSDRLAREVQGVRDVHVQLQSPKKQSGTALSLTLDLVIGQEAEISSLSSQIMEKIRRHLDHMMSLNDIPIQIVVSEVTDAAPVRKHRVV